MNQAAQYLNRICDLAQNMKEFQRGFLGIDVTTCNLFTRSILSWQAGRCFIPDFNVTDFNYDLQAIRPGVYLREIMMDTLTGVEYDNVLKASQDRTSILQSIPGIDTMEIDDYVKDKMRHERKLAALKLPEEVTELAAYGYAKQGIPIVAISKMLKPLGHQCIIAPQDEPYDEAKGNRIVQAGWFNGFFWMKEIFVEIWRSPASDIKYFKFPFFAVTI